MTPTQLQEEISKAYLHALAAKNGFAVGQWSQDHGCVDATVGAASTLGAGLLSKPKLDVQLKATAQADAEKSDHVAWTLDVDHYDALRATTHVPHILVVLLLPSEVTSSVEHSLDHLLIRRCAYWVWLKGAPAAEPGQKTKTIHVPKANVFSPDGLRAILERISQGRDP